MSCCICVLYWYDLCVYFLPIITVKRPKMPRRSTVSLEERIALVEKYIDNFKKKPYPISTANIWKLMSNELNGRWSAFNVYVNVSQNQMGILSTALSNKEIPFYNDTDVTCNFTMNLSTNNNHENLSEFETELHDLDEFKIYITSEEWKQMKGPIMQYNENRTYPILQPGVWTDILSLALYYQMELPCAFVFKHSKIYESSGSLHYLRITGHCKSKTCRNPF